MKKLFLSFALALGILTVQAQSDSNTDSKQTPTQSTTDKKLDKEAKKQGTSNSTNDAETSEEQTPQLAATPADTTGKELQPADKKDPDPDKE